MNTPDPILVSIVHPDSLVRSCLVSAIDRAQGIEVNLAVAQVCALDALAEAHARSHVVIADYEPGIELASRASRDVRLQPVIVVSGVDREWELRNALAHRVRGYLIPGFELEHLDEGVRAVRSGRRYLCTRAAARLAESLSFETLTDREAEVLALVVRGEPNKLISRQLAISIGTVKSHIKSTYGKLCVASRTQAIATAERRGLLRRDAEQDVAPWLKATRAVTMPPRSSLDRMADVAFG